MESFVSSRLTMLEILRCALAYAALVLWPALSFGQSYLTCENKINHIAVTWSIHGKTSHAIVLPHGSNDIQSFDWCTTSKSNVVIAWSELTARKNDTDIFAQKLMPDGTRAWGEHGVVVTEFRGQQCDPKVAATPDDGVFVVWQSDSAGADNINLWCMRLLGNGAAAWAMPASVCSYAGNQLHPAIVYDGEGGALIAWEDYRNGDADIFGQRIELDGSPTGPEDGSAIQVAPGDQSGVRFEVNRSGATSAIVWHDHRVGFTEPVQVETDLSRFPVPEPSSLIALLLSLVVFRFSRD